VFEYLDWIYEYRRLPCLCWNSCSLMCGSGDSLKHEHCLITDLPRRPDILNLRKYSQRFLPSLADFNASVDHEMRVAAAMNKKQTTLVAGSKGFMAPAVGFKGMKCSISSDMFSPSVCVCSTSHLLAQFLKNI